MIHSVQCDDDNLRNVVEQLLQSSNTIGSQPQPGWTLACESQDFRLRYIGIECPEWRESEDRPWEFRVEVQNSDGVVGLVSFDNLTQDEAIQVYKNGTLFLRRLEQMG